jgi:hypothetical protein
VAVSLSDRPVALILDERVIATLERLGWFLHLTAHRHADRYVAYVEEIQRWATALSAQLNMPITGEHVEWLLYYRNRDKPSLYRWLGTDPLGP